MRQAFCYHDLPVVPWRNGGGTTREICCFPPDSEAFGWRASIATISTDGPFSLFPGVDRVITLLQGDPVLLRSDAGQHLLRLHQPWPFAGEMALHATLCGKDGSTDFNIMTRRDSWRAAVTLGSRPCQSEHGVAWVLSGQWQCAAGPLLSPDNGIWWMDELNQLTPLTSDARLLFTHLLRVS